jgi:hypothetical protein
MADRQERDPRVETRLPVRLSAGGGEGITRNVSATGVYMEIGAEVAVGESIELTVELSSEQGPLWLACSGQVMRVERIEGKLGVAVRFSESRLSKPLERAAVADELTG